MYQLCKILASGNYNLEPKVDLKAGNVIEWVMLHKKYLVVSLDSSLYMLVNVETGIPTPLSQLAIGFPEEIQVELSAINACISTLIHRSSEIKIHD